MMKMKLFLFLITAFILGNYNSTSQIIRGKIKPDSKWKRVVYLIEITNYKYGFGGTNDAIVDSLVINGADYFTSNRLKKDQLYRLNVVPDDSPDNGGIIQDGINDNYAFFTTDSSEDEIIFTADISSFFRTYQCISSNTGLNNIQRDISVLKKVKMPVYDLMYDLSLKMDSIAQAAPNSINDFNAKAISDIQKENDLSNALLLESMDSMINPNVIALGLIFDGIGFQHVQQDVLRYKSKLAAFNDLPLIQSILNSNIYDVDLSFLSANYRLMDDKHLIMDSLRTKFILLDFWASWCIPCRQSINTTLKDLGKNFNKDVLTIVGINTDKKKDAALIAIKADKNPNRQIGGKNAEELASRFNIDRLPMYVLINPTTKEWQLFDSAELVASYLEQQQFR